MTFRELREIRPEAFQTAAASWRALVQAVRAHATGLGRHTESLAGAWEGPAYQAATAHLAGQQRDLAGDADRMAEVAEILTAHATRLAEAKAELQAAQRAEEHIRRAVAALPPTARLERLLFGTAPCADATVPGPEGRVNVSREYWLRGLPKENNRAYFDTLYEFWTRNGYRVLSDDRANRESMYLWVEHTGDSFRLSIQSNDYGDLSIGADSPCIWPKGTPEPEEP